MQEAALNAWRSIHRLSEDTVGMRPRPGRVLVRDGERPEDAEAAGWLTMAEANATLAARLVAAGARPLTPSA